MSVVLGQAAVCGRVDAQGRLVTADPKLAALNSRAGGDDGGLLVVPSVAALARLAGRLGIVVSRAAVVADGDRDLDLWVRAEPDGEGIALSISGWTERAPRAPAVFAANQREADFMRAAADWNWETDDALRFTSLSSGAAGIIGKSSAELIGKQLTRLFRFLEAKDGRLPILNALAEQRRFDDQVAELRGMTRALYRLDGVPLLDGSGRFAGFRGHATSLEEEPGLGTVPPDEAPAFAERLDQALRTPLAHIISNAETIGTLPDGPLASDYASYAVDIATAGRHLLALVDDLVDLQAIEQPDFRPELERIDLADVARRAAGLLAVRAGVRGVRIDRPGDDEVLPATGEFRRALQILMNLLTNAIRYSPDDGMIWIRAEQDGDLTSIVIADQGKGIAFDDQARIFDKFERVDQAEPGGTGLGLYIARRLARAMGGDIVVDSAPGQGARFAFTLPAVAD